MALIDTPFERVTDMMKVLPDLVRLRADRSVAAFVNRYIRDPRLRQVFSFHPLLVGGNPFQSTSIYALIHTLEQRWGVWFAMGGTGALVRALVRLFEELGGVLRLDAEVDGRSSSSRRRGERTGVRLASGGSSLPAEVVVCNGDVAQTYMARSCRPPCDAENTDRRYERMRYSMSLFVMYFGTDRTYDDVAHHEILMGPRYEELLDDIFTRQDAVAGLLAVPASAHGDRPDRSHRRGATAFTCCRPYRTSAAIQTGRRRPEAYRDAIVAHLEANHLPGLSKHIVTERVIDPRHFRDTSNSYLGSAFSVEPILTQSAWFRPHNRSEDVAQPVLSPGRGRIPGPAFRAYSARERSSRR